MRRDSRDSAGYSIFPLKAKDAPELAALEAACFSTAFGEAQYAALLGGVEERLAGKGPPPFLALGLRIDGRLAAYVSLGLHRAAGELEIHNLAVHDDFRRKGLGKILLEQALRIGTRLELTRAVLEVRAGNTAARALYAAAGFGLCGRRKAYYADTGEDALVLSRNLP
jgi:ribosomal-protein-alanine N-acetyltransferase